MPGENDFAGTFPELADQWHPTKNGALCPESVTAYSNKKVWWLCERGHDYQAAISDRAKGKGCPYCAGRKIWKGFNDLTTLDPELAEQWHPKLNGDLTPEMVTLGSHKKVWWQCPVGHIWKAVVASRAGKQRTGCPVCAGRVREDRQEHYIALEAKERI